MKNHSDQQIVEKLLKEMGVVDQEANQLEKIMEYESADSADEQKLEWSDNRVSEAENYTFKSLNN